MTNALLQHNIIIGYIIQEKMPIVHQRFTLVCSV